MAVATTQAFHELVLEVETATPGTYAKLCGLIDVTVSRTANLDTNEIPDCTDESLPLSVRREVRSLEVTVSATGVWARESWGTMSDWFYSGDTKNVRITNVGAATGDIEFETGAAFLTSLSNARAKGQKVTASLEIMFDGTPTTTDQAA